MQNPIALFLPPSAHQANLFAVANLKENIELARNGLKIPFTVAYPF
jgi:alanine racemase